MGGEELGDHPARFLAGGPGRDRRACQEWRSLVLRCSTVFYSELDPRVAVGVGAYVQSNQRLPNNTWDVRISHSNHVRRLV